jgi:hypothetical protein
MRKHPLRTPASLNQRHHSAHLVNCGQNALFFFLLTALTGSELFAGALPAVEQARVIAVKNYSRGRIAYWEGRVPIYDDYPFFDISLAVGSKQYVVRYESLTGYYPSAWQQGSEIQVRKQVRGRMILMNGSEEVTADIVNARAQDCVYSSGPPTGGDRTAGSLRIKRAWQPDL